MISYDSMFCIFFFLSSLLCGFTLFLCTFLLIHKINGFSTCLKAVRYACSVLKNTKNISIYMFIACRLYKTIFCLFACGIFGILLNQKNFRWKILFQNDKDISNFLPKKLKNWKCTQSETIWNENQLVFVIFFLNREHLK